MLSVTIITRLSASMDLALSFYLSCIEDIIDTMIHIYECIML